MEAKEIRTWEDVRNFNALQWFCILCMCTGHVLIICLHLRGNNGMAVLFTETGISLMLLAVAITPLTETDGVRDMCATLRVAKKRLPPLRMLLNLTYFSMVAIWSLFNLTLLYACLHTESWKHFLKLMYWLKYSHITLHIDPLVWWYLAVFSAIAGRHWKAFSSFWQSCQKEARATLP